MIDIKLINSPGWWMQKACRKRESRLPRLQLLADYHEGKPRLPQSTGQDSKAFVAFAQQSCTNFAELIVGSVRERVSLRDIRTAASGDQVDDEAWNIWLANGLDTEFADVLENMLAMGDSYMIVGEDEDGEIAITGEDPRQVATIHNPVRQSEIRAAVKVFHDPDVGRDYVYLYVAGVIDPETSVRGNARRYVAYRDRKTSQRAMTAFNASTFFWDDDFGGEEGEELKHERVPVVRFRNRRGVGEFEPHLDILDRINHDVYNRMVIALYQAFKQRAIQVDDAEAEGDDGESVPDLSDILTSDPGSWLQLPFNSKVWESSQADLQGILSATSDDIKQLAAVTRRPMSIFAPDNQSAAGADFTREGLTFAVEDKQTRAGQGIKDVFELAFLTKGDDSRADKTKMIVGWNPAERYSITDKGDAGTKAVSVLAKRTTMREVYQFSPAQIAQAEAEAADELLLTTELTPAPAEVTPQNANAA